VKVENDVADLFIAQQSLEGRHNAAPPRQDGGANEIVGGRCSTGETLSLEHTAKIGGHFCQVEGPSPGVTAAAVHGEEHISPSDCFCAPALHVGGIHVRARQQQDNEEDKDEPSLADRTKHGVNFLGPLAGC
jgi:hypothetical protein